MAMIFHAFATMASAATFDETGAEEAVQVARERYHLILDLEGSGSAPCSFEVAESVTARAFAAALVDACLPGFTFRELAGHVVVADPDATVSLLDMQVQAPAGRRTLGEVADDLEVQVQRQLASSFVAVDAPNGLDRVLVDVAGGQLTVRNVLLGLTVVPPEPVMGEAPYVTFKEDVVWLSRTNAIGNALTGGLPSQVMLLSLVHNTVEAAPDPRHRNLAQPELPSGTVQLQDAIDQITTNGDQFGLAAAYQAMLDERKRAEEARGGQ
jgi:hypothetical protein